MQVSLRDGAVVGHASPKEIAGAAAQLQRTCVIERGMGGYAFNIGEHELARKYPGRRGAHRRPITFRVSSCLTKTACIGRRRQQSPGRTRQIRTEHQMRPLFQTRPAVDFLRLRVLEHARQQEPPGLWILRPTQHRRKLTARTRSRQVCEFLSRTHVDAEPLLYAGDGRCLVEIGITGHTSTLATWYEIWAAVAAITSMCTRGKGIGGKARGLGEFLVRLCPGWGLVLIRWSPK